MRLGCFVPLPGPFRVSGAVWRRRGRRGGTSGCLPWIALALAIGLPVSAVQSCQAKEAAGYTDPAQLAAAIKGYAQQKTGTAPAAGVVRPERGHPRLHLLRQLRRSADHYLRRGYHAGRQELPRHRAHKLDKLLGDR